MDLKYNLQIEKRNYGSNALHNLSSTHMHENTFTGLQEEKADLNFLATTQLF